MKGCVEWVSTARSCCFLALPAPHLALGFLAVEVWLSMVVQASSDPKASWSNKGSFLKILICLAASALGCSMQDLCCIMQDLVLCLQTLVVAHMPQSIQASLAAAHRLSCSTACGILVSQAGIEPTCPALQGKFLTTGPPGSPEGPLYLPRMNEHISFSTCCLV